MQDFEAIATLVGGPDHFQRIEQRDQASNFNRLPRCHKTHWGSDDPASETALLKIAERLGFKIGDVVEDGHQDFRFVEPPKGWRMVPTDHYMYSDLVDEKGRKRGYQGFKAASYDRWTSFHWLCRYKIEEESPEGWYEMSHPKTLTEQVLRKAVINRDEKKTGDKLLGYADEFDLTTGKRLRIASRSMYSSFGVYDEYDGYRDKPRDDRIVVERMVDVPLPDAQQPTPHGYHSCQVLRDTATGEVVFRSAPYYNPTVNEDRAAYLAMDDTRKVARAEVIQFANKAYHFWRNPLYYWKRP